VESGASTHHRVDDDDVDDGFIVYEDTSQLALVARQPLVAKHPVAPAANHGNVLTACPVIN